MDNQRKMTIVSLIAAVGVCLCVANTSKMRCHPNPNTWLLVDFLLVALALLGVHLVNSRSRKIKIGVWTYFVVGSVFSVLWNLWGLFAIFSAYFRRRPCLSAINFFLALLFWVIIAYAYYLVGRKLVSSGEGGESFIIRLQRFIQEDIRRADQPMQVVNYAPESLRQNQMAYSDEPLLENEIRRVGSAHDTESHPQQPHHHYAVVNNQASADPMTLLSDFKPSPQYCAFCHTELTPFDDILTRVCGHSIHGRCFHQAREEREGCPACAAHN